MTTLDIRCRACGKESAGSPREKRRFPRLYCSVACENDALTRPFAVTCGRCGAEGISAPVSATHGGCLCPNCSVDAALADRVRSLISVGGQEPPVRSIVEVARG